ncbi:treacle protein-like [Haliaeetus albicilla]|uniref:treacle protein-like n=1 Tax=Haliaeetus albicilla TaxID=8969 RepID=UPI0037E732F3
MAGLRQRTPKMPMDEEANARSQPADRLPSLQKRSQVGRQQPEAAPQGGRSQASSLRGDRLPRLESSQATGSRHTQTDSLARRVAQPRSRAARAETTRLPALTPLPRPVVAARHAPTAWPPGAASTRCKLPPLPAAPATSSASGRETGTSTAASGHRRIVPSARGVRGDQGTAARVQVQRPAPLSPTARAAAAKGTAQCLRSEVPGKVAAASRRPSRQPEAPRDGAHGTAVATTARTDEVGAADSGTAPTARPALAEEEEWEEDSDKELSQGEDFTTNTIWVNPLVPEVVQDPHAGPHAGPSSEGTEAAAEEAGERQNASPAAAGLTDAEPAGSSLPSPHEEEGRHTLLAPAVQDEAKKSPASPVIGERQNASPAPAGLTDAEPAGPALDAAPEEEGRHALLAPAVQDEAKKSPASPVFGEQDTAAEAESQAPAPHSSMAFTADLQDIADRIVREVLMKSLAALKIPSQQPVEQRDLAHSMAVATTETTNEVQATDSGEDEAPAAQPALAEVEEWEEDRDKELSQEEDFTINTIWVNPLVPEVVQDPHASSHTGPSSEGAEAAAEEAGERQSASPAPAGLTDAEPAGSAVPSAHEEEGHHAPLSPAVQDEAKKSPASPVFGERQNASPAAAGLTDAEPAGPALDAAPEEEGHHALLAPAVQDEAKKSPASPVFGEQDTAAEAESQAPAPHSSMAFTADLQDIADRIVREVLMKSLAALKIPSQQPVEQRDLAHSMAVATTETTNEVQATDSGEDEAPAAQPALAEVEEWEDDSDKELSQGEDFTTNTIWVNPLVLELFQDPHTGPRSEGGEAAAEAAGERQSASPAPAGLTDAEPAGSALPSAHEEEGHHALLDPAVQDEAKKSPASPVFGEQDTAAEAESQAPALHSSMAFTADLQEIANRIVREVLMKSLAALKIPSQQPAEQRDRAHSMDVVMAPRTPAGPQDFESPLAREPRAEAITAPLVPAACADGEDTASPMSGEQQEEASSTVVSQAAQQDEVASSSPPNPLADAGAPHLAPAVDEEGEAAASSPLARDPQHQVSQAHVAGTGHPKAREAGAAPGLCAAGRWLVLSVSSQCHLLPPSPVRLLSPCRRPPSTEATRSNPPAVATCPRTTQVHSRVECRPGEGSTTHTGPSAAQPPQPLAYSSPFLSPQASPPSRTPQLNGDGPPSSGGRSGLCAGRSALPAWRDSKSSSAPLPAPGGSPEKAAGPEPA